MTLSLRVSGYGAPRATELDAAAALDNGSLAVISTLDWSDPNALWEKTGGGWVLAHHVDREDLGDLSVGHLAQYATGTVVKTGTGVYRKGADGWVSVVIHDLDEQPGPTVSGAEPAGAMYTDRRPDSAWWRLDEDAWVDAGAGVESPDTAAGVSFDPSGLAHTTADNIQDAMGDLDAAIESGLIQQAINAQAGAAYTLDDTDPTKLITLSHASAITLTVPRDSDVDWAVGDWCEGLQLDAGQVTVVAGSGATLHATPGAKARAQHSRFFLQKIAADTWALAGDISA